MLWPWLGYQLSAVGASNTTCGVNQRCAAVGLGMGLSDELAVELAAVLMAFSLILARWLIIVWTQPKLASAGVQIEGEVGFPFLYL